MKLPTVCTNWKMNKTLAETRDYFLHFLKQADRFNEKVEIVLLVPHTVLATAANLTIGSKIRVGSQDHFWEDFGSFTGEVSAAMVRDCGGEYAMIGHYERRRYFHETVDAIYRKAKAALRNDLVPIVCIGESSEERESDETRTAIRDQMVTIFKDFSPEEMNRCQILYEPFWAVGAENPASPEQAQEAHLLIREEIANRFDRRLAGKVKVLYGGSVRWDNVSDFLMQADIDGVGVGRAGWDPDSFLEILDAAASANLGEE
jgi:triosephosphate isomerase